MRTAGVARPAGGAPASLPEAARAHRSAIDAHVERLPGLADLVGRGDLAATTAAFEAECAFITEELVPHIEAVESALYERLERLMDGRHSMAPMREEHALLRRLIASLCAYRASLATGALSPAEAVGLRRALYRLYTILKVHLAEEELYLGVIDRDLTPEEKDGLARSLDHARAQPL
jgi:hypothetical protein